ncbi:MAG TPA: cobalamin-binding protein [Euryarchaeota archaeon]|nr:cobalamin-binding protein [Euryarchaeota archaeon]
MSSQEAIEQLKNAVINYELDSVKELAQNMLEKGVDPLDAIENGLGEGIKIVGERFGAGEIFLPELIMGAETMKAAMSVLEPALPAGGAGRTSKGKILIGTVLDDIHEIGKNLVATLLSSNGYDVVDLGVNVPKDEFHKKASEVKPNVIALSALMTTTMPHMEEVVKDLGGSGVKTMIGGAPVTDEFAKKIGADGYSEDASGAVNLALKLLQK